MATETKVLKLQRSQSGIALGLKVTFTGAGPMKYSDGRPPAGGMTIDFEANGESNTATVPQRRWGEEIQALGYTFRVLNSPELDPMTLEIEIRKS